MTEMTLAQTGTFCWPELATTDTAAASAFYGALFGWQSMVIESPMGPYLFQRLGERDVAGFHALHAEQAAQGVPPNWLTYVSVDSADEVAAKASTLGGTVIAPPFEVMDYGRMAVLQDPQGAVFALWQPKRHNQGAFAVNEPGAPCWAELGTRDAAAASAFYTGLFGWGAKGESGGGTSYTEWTLQGKSFGGMRSLQGEPDYIPSHWMIYFLVKDSAAAEARAKDLGAQILMPTMEIPGVGHFAVIQDPQGAIFAVYQSALS